jgi:hypothetical protein
MPLRIPEINDIDRQADEQQSDRISGSFSSFQVWNPKKQVGKETRLENNLSIKTRMNYII